MPLKESLYSIKSFKKLDFLRTSPTVLHCFASSVKCNLFIPHLQLKSFVHDIITTRSGNNFLLRTEDYMQLQVQNKHQDQKNT